MAAKVFEVGDVLPQGTVRISWDLENLRIPSGYTRPSSDEFTFIEDNNYERILEIFCSHNDYGYSMSIYGIQVADYDNTGGNTWISPYTGLSGGHNYIDIDTSSFDLDKRTVKRKDLYAYHDERLFWEEVITGYSITFEENGGTSVTDLTEQTTLPSPLPTTTKANHIFAGWYYDNLFTQKANAGDELTANVTLYAKWYTPTTWCEDVADAIREKEGSSEPIKHVDFPDRIRAL